MRDHIRSGYVSCLTLLLLVPALAFAAEPATSTEATTAASPTTNRFTLKSSGTEVAPLQSGRYSLRARFAPAESAGELREGDRFTVIGRFAKGTVNCDFNAIFSNGFEGN